MSYADNLQYDSEVDSCFVRVSCRIIMDTASAVLDSGTRYYLPFTYGPVHAIGNNATELTEVSSLSAMGANKFYYDHDNQRVYYDLGGDPVLNMVATFYLFFSDTEMIWYETPTDDTSREVLWRALVKEQPAFKITIPPKGMGFFPIDPTSLVLVNDHSLNYLLGNGSFRRTDVDVWHRLGELTTSNIQKRLSGLVGLRISINEESIIFDVVDRSIEFDRQPRDQRTYDGSSAIDPRFHNTPAMKAIGACGGWDFATLGGTGGQYYADYGAFFEMVNCDYDAEAPTTSNNRKFAMLYDPSGYHTELSMAGSLRPGGTNQFNLNTPGDEQNLRTDELVWFDGAADQYLIVDTVVPGTVFFTTAPGGGSNQTGNLRRAPFDVYLIKSGVTPYRLKYGRDFTLTTHLTNIKGITLTSTAEANNGVATFDPNTDAIWCVPSGRRNQVTWNGNNVGTNTEMKSAEKVLFQFLKEECDLDDDQIDYDAISELADLIPYQIFVPMPLVQLDDYPTLREVLDLILKSCMARGYFDADGVFTVRPYAPITTTDETVDKEEIFKDSFNYEIDYSEVKSVSLIEVWNGRARHRLGFSGSTKDDILNGTAQLKFLETENPTIAQGTVVQSSKGLYLHKTEIVELYEHLVAYDPDAYFINRMAVLFGERDGLMRISGKRLALLQGSGDTLTVNRDSLPGLDDADGNSAPFEIAEIEKAGDETRLTLNDNKAAQDNTAYWP